MTDEFCNRKTAESTEMKATDIFGLIQRLDRCNRHILTASTKQMTVTDKIGLSQSNLLSDTTSFTYILQSFAVNRSQGQTENWYLQ